MTTSRTVKPKRTAKQPRQFRGETPLGRALIAGMRDVLRHVRGEIDLPTREFPKRFAKRSTNSAGWKTGLQLEKLPHR
jgi:hypothetical protein